MLSKNALGYFLKIGPEKTKSHYCYNSIIFYLESSIKNNMTCHLTKYISYFKEVYPDENIEEISKIVERIKNIK